MLQNPFQDANKRANRALYFSVLLSGLLSWFNLALTEAAYGETKYNASDWVFLFVTIANILFSVFLMLLVSHRLGKPGMTSDVRTQIKARYIEYVLVFVILSFPINIITRPEYKYTTISSGYQAGTLYADKWWKCTICGFGIIMAFSRFRDPSI